MSPPNEDHPITTILRDLDKLRDRWAIEADGIERHHIEVKTEAKVLRNCIGDLWDIMRAHGWEDD